MVGLYLGLAHSSKAALVAGTAGNLDRPGRDDQQPGGIGESDIVMFHEKVSRPWLGHFLNFGECVL